MHVNKGESPYNIVFIEFNFPIKVYLRLLFWNNLIAVEEKPTFSKK